MSRLSHFTQVGRSSNAKGFPNTLAGAESCIRAAKSSKHHNRIPFSIEYRPGLVSGRTTEIHEMFGFDVVPAGHAERPTRKNRERRRESEERARRRMRRNEPLTGNWFKASAQLPESSKSPTSDVS